MVNKLKTAFLEPKPIEEYKDTDTIDYLYKKWRLKVFINTYLAYVVFYLCRKNLSVALLPIGEVFSLSNTKLGMLRSASYVTYGIGKFLNGVLADKYNIKILTPLALSFSGFINIAFVAGSTFIFNSQFKVFNISSDIFVLWFMIFLWGFNGWFQSMGFPIAAKGLTHWFSNKERGFKWSLWSTSQAVGIYVSALLSSALLYYLGWKTVFYIPGIIAILYSIFLFKNLVNKPSSIGLPDIEIYHSTIQPDNNKNVKIIIEENNKKFFEIFKEYILYNKYIWLLALAYIFVYILELGTIDWMCKYLVEVKKDSVTSAGFKMSFLPLFGIVGYISSGFISDKYFSGKRLPVIMIYLIGLLINIIGLKIYNNYYIDIINIGFIGLFVCGLQVMVGGLCAIEYSSKKVASTVVGFIGAFGYVGGFLSSNLTGIISDKLGWVFIPDFWIISDLLCVVVIIMLFLCKRKAY